MTWSPASPWRGTDARTPAVVALWLLAGWAYSILWFLPQALAEGAGLLAILGLILYGWLGGGPLLFAAACQRRGERLLAFSVLVASFPYMAMRGQIPLLAGSLVALVLIADGWQAGSMGRWRPEPYDLRLLAASGATTLRWVLLLAGANLGGGFGHGPGRPDMFGTLVMVGAALPGLVALWQGVQALLAVPPDRDWRSLIPLGMVAAALLLSLLA